MSFDGCPRSFVFAKKHNTLRSINKSFNLVIPCAKLKSHIYLAKNKALLANDIFYLTWCDDLWPLPSVSCIWHLIHMEESELCCLNDLGGSPRPHRVTCWLKTPRLYTVLFPARTQSPTLPPSDPSHCGFHMECIFTPRLLSLCEHMDGDRRRRRAHCCLLLAITEMPKAFTVSVQLWPYIRICLSPFAFT